LLLTANAVNICSYNLFAVRMNLSSRTAMLITPLLGLSYALAVALIFKDSNDANHIKERSSIERLKGSAGTLSTSAPHGLYEMRRAGCAARAGRYAFQSDEHSGLVLFRQQGKSLNSQLATLRPTNVYCGAFRKRTRLKEARSSRKEDTRRDLLYFSLA
jgi:hypothetical protein